MDTSEVEFRPSLLTGDHKRFAAALTGDEYNQRRRLVTEAALTQLGSTTSAYSNFHPHTHRHRMRDVTCDAEGPRRGYAPLLCALTAGVAVVGAITAGVFVLNLSEQQSQVIQDSAFPMGRDSPSIPLPASQCPIRETVLELGRMEPWQVPVSVPVAEFAKARVEALVASPSSLEPVSTDTVDQPQPDAIPLVAAVSRSADGDADSEDLPVQSHTSDHVITPSPVPPPTLIEPVEMCICTNAKPINVCMTGQLLETACPPLRSVQQPLVPAPPLPEHMPLQQQPSVQTPPLTQDPPPIQDKPEPQEHLTLPSVPEGPTDVHTAAVAPSASAAPDSSSVHPPHTLLPTPPSSHPFYLPPAPAHAPARTRTPGASAAHVLEQLEAVLSCRSLRAFLTELRSAIAQPHGALVMWVAVLTPLLSIFALCFTLSMALQLARVVLGAMSNICSASSHFTLQRLGAIARKLVPDAPSSPEEVMLLELQAAMSQREADCRAKDEQLASLRQLLDGLQLELQRCSDAEKDLRCKYRKLLETTQASVGKRKASSKVDRCLSETSNRSSLIPSPIEQQAQLSATGSAFSDSDSDGEMLARLRASPAALTGAATCPAPVKRCAFSTATAPTPSSVPPPPRLGRVGGSAACAQRSAHAHGFSSAAETLPLSEAPSPSSDRSEAGFATCRADPATALH